MLPDAAPGSPTFTVVAIYDPAYVEPLLVATPLALTPPERTLPRVVWVHQVRAQGPMVQTFLYGHEMSGMVPTFVLSESHVFVIACRVPSFFISASPAAGPYRLARV